MEINLLSDYVYIIYTYFFYSAQISIAFSHFLSYLLKCLESSEMVIRCKSLNLKRSSNYDLYCCIACWPKLFIYSPCQSKRHICEMQTEDLKCFGKHYSRVADLSPRTEKLTTSLIEYVLRDHGILLLHMAGCLYGVWLVIHVYIYSC